MMIPPESPPEPAVLIDTHTPFRRMYLLLAAVGAPFILLLPPPAPTIIIAALVVVLAALLADDRQALSKIIHSDLPGFATPARLYTAEIIFILLVLALATRHLQNFRYDQRLSGNEFTYLINSGVIAADAYHETGAIPLWNPYMGRGEPLIENPFSFVLNPLMTLPIVWFGALQGTLAAVLLHVGMMSIGGWLLGWMLRLKTAGRLLLALLLGSSGSFVAPLGMGFYQMSLSQAYVPWVYAALLGIISRPTERRWTIVFVAATALLIFAGTFWYVLPTAVGCALLISFHVARQKPGTRRLSIDRGLLLRVAVAGGLVIALAAVRLLPQAVHSAFVWHPLEQLDDAPASLYAVFRTFVTPVVVPPFDTPAIHYHYLIPLTFAAALVIGRILLPALGFALESRGQIIIPALILIALFAGWAQAGDFARWLYQMIPLLREWRFVGRMLAAAAIWIAVLAALCLDQIVGVLWRVVTAPDETLPKRWRAVPRRASVIAGLALAGMLIFSAQSANNVLTNWRNRTSIESNGFLERAPLVYLRKQVPDGFLAVLTYSFFGYLPFYENRVRTTFGNPDYHPLPVAPTIGTVKSMAFPPSYAFDLSNLAFLDYLQRAGYAQTGETNNLFRPDLIWYNPTVPAYMFVVPETVLQDREEPLTANLTREVTRFTHQLDTIDVTITDYGIESILVAQEVAYPGWQVSIDGEAASIESVGGLIGVRLPARPDDTPVHVVFAYRPTWLYLGAAITLVGMVALAVFGFGLERWMKRLRTG